MKKKASSMKKKFAFLIASVFGVGYSPFASGTCASLLTIFASMAVAYYFGFWGIIVAAVTSFFIGVLVSHEVLKHTKHDPSLIVIDEFSGQILSFVFVAPALTHVMNAQALILYGLGFFFFRLFDITKPWLVGEVDGKMENAWGVMLDDILSGLFAGTCLSAIILFM